MSLPPGQRLLIFIVAYNAEKTLAQVLQRIPAELRRDEVEVLVIDDFSEDHTYAAGLAFARQAGLHFKVTMLRTPWNQGYGGNQKLGYRYAIEHGFDLVALLHGDGQYAPEKLPDLLGPFAEHGIDAVFGSRMLEHGAARRGGMPAYKWLGNHVLSAVQNWMLGTRFSEFHSGYRIYAVDALRQIPFERNTNGFHFDTEIVVQFVHRRLCIREVPIPTYYGDEICHVNGLRYAWDVLSATVHGEMHRRDLFFDPRFDVSTAEPYELKKDFLSSHSLALAAVKKGAAVLDVGCGSGLVAQELAREARHVTGVDQTIPRVENPKLAFVQWDLDSPNLPVDAAQFDQIYLLDIIEHLHEPEIFLEKLRRAVGSRQPEIVLSTPNVAFFVTRLMLFFGRFNYGRRGILDRTHTRLFTWDTLRTLLRQCGYAVEEMRGIPAPFPLALGRNIWSRALLKLNGILLRLWPQAFAYQIFVRARILPTVDHLLEEMISQPPETAASSRGAPH